MGLLDMFDKIDDIVYEPVKTICEWLKEPLRKREHSRNMDAQAQQINAEKNAQEAKFRHAMDFAKQETENKMIMEKMKQDSARKAVENKMAQKKLEQELKEKERKSVNADLEAKAKIEADIRRWNAEIDQMILQKEDERRARLVECMKRYQIDLANATRDIVNSIGLMSLELREKANQMVIEKTKEYRALQDESKKQSLLELREVKEMFFKDDPDTYKIMVSDIIQERSSAIELASRFIVELSEDMKRLNQNTDELMRIGMENTSKYIAPMTNGLGVTLSTTIEDNNTQKNFYIDDSIY
ncbi:MAG: hypothetical protein K2J39_01350 [Ruminococcus sp.]|nr:hypothetical protein [Ruminococcus sp.]